MKKLTIGLIGLLFVAASLLGRQESTFVTTHFDQKKGKEYISLWLDYTNTEQVPVAITAQFGVLNSNPTVEIPLSSDAVGVGVHELSPWPQDNSSLNNSLKGKLRCGIRDLPSATLRKKLGDKFTVNIVALLPPKHREVQTLEYGATAQGGANLDFSGPSEARAPLAREVVLHKVTLDYSNYNWSATDELSTENIVANGGARAPNPPVVPPVVGGLPKAPPADPTRDVDLFTQTQLAEAVAAALKDTVTLADLEAAEHEAADLAFEEGVAAVQARPDFYGLATRSLLGTQPFVKGWVYAPQLEWVHITDDLFPFVFVEKLESWVFVQEKEGGLAYFVYLTREWLTYEELKVSQHNKVLTAERKKAEAERKKSEAERYRL